VARPDGRPTLLQGPGATHGHPPRPAQCQRTHPPSQPPTTDCRPRQAAGSRPMRAFCHATGWPIATGSPRSYLPVWRGQNGLRGSETGGVGTNASGDVSAALSYVNGAALSHTISSALSNTCMKVVEEVRRLRLAELRAEYGTFAAINAKLERTSTDATLSQIANSSSGSKTNKPKTMGSPQARLIEEKLGKPVGWMDTDPALIDATAASWPFPNITPEQFAGLSAEVKKAAEAVLLSALPLGESAASLEEHKAPSKRRA